MWSITKKIFAVAALVTVSSGQFIAFGSKDKHSDTGEQNILPATVEWKKQPVLTASQDPIFRDVLPTDLRPLIFKGVMRKSFPADIQLGDQNSRELLRHDDAPPSWLENKQQTKNATLLSQWEFWYMRHGLTSFNRDDILMGSLDIPLNEEGKRQAAQTAEGIALLLAVGKLQITRIASSPQRRALQTAEIIARITSLDLVIVEELREVCGGELEGMKKVPGHVQNWEKGFTPLGGESLVDAQRRLILGLSRSLAGSEKVLIISHSQIYRAMQCLAGWPEDKLGHCEIRHIKPHKDNPKLWVSERVLLTLAKL